MITSKNSYITVSGDNNNVYMSVKKHGSKEWVQFDVSKVIKYHPIGSAWFFGRDGTRVVWSEKFMGHFIHIDYDIDIRHDDFEVLLCEAQDLYNRLHQKSLNLPPIKEIKKSPAMKDTKKSPIKKEQETIAIENRFEIMDI